MPAYHLLPYASWLTWVHAGNALGLLLQSHANAPTGNYEHEDRGRGPHHATLFKMVWARKCR
eukprot:CAMPEP_0197903296 /NCGR_PEP_ID=MMETSP1439-20131203/55617_1 /TAXON_ID=66791 /ORGANISM="Gonyaulax spinifera, Strain CCMP409" /LENGTH=61 /DNA_ID=CAMNT_0043524407 /DNA_START=24 /DNA_END=206 /DNA_ORIENTATION=-